MRLVTFPLCVSTIHLRLDSTNWSQNQNMSGITPLEETTDDSTFLTYISCRSYETSRIKSSCWIFFFIFICLSTKAQITSCFYWHRLCSFWAVSVHSCGANRGRPAVKSNPNETLHLCCLEGVWAAWTSFSAAAPHRIQPAWLSCSGWGLEVMGHNLNQADPPATLQRVPQGNWGKHSLPSSYFRPEWGEIY